MRLRRMVGWFVTGWAAWRLFGPEIPPATNGPQTRPDLPGRTVTVGRHEFFVREAGPPDGDVVLLVHGWLYPGLATWHRVIPLLAEHHRVIVPDLRDHGKSDRIRGRFEIADMADDVAAILDALDVGSATVVGWSLGGMVAQEMARRHSTRVKSLVLGATAARPSPISRWVTVPLALLARGVGRVDRLLVPRVSFWYLRKAGAVPGDHAAWVWETLLDRDMTLYHEAGFAMLRFDARKWVGSLRMPITVVIPTSDQMMPISRQRELADHLNDAAIVELSGARHEAVFTHPDDLVRVVIDAARRGRDVARGR